MPNGSARSAAPTGPHGTTTPYEKLFVPFNSAVSVTNTGNGRVVIGGTTYAEVASWVFHQVDGQQTVVFRSDLGEMLMFIGGQPALAFIKVAWYEAATLHLVLVMACMLLFFSSQHSCCGRFSLF